MARKRMIDPSIWTDEGMAELSPRQQLLYIGLFSNADDEGRLKGGAAGIRLMLPTLYAGVDPGEIAVDVDAVLLQMRQLMRYEVDGRQYFAFKNFRQWQSINRPSDSHLPAPPENTSTDDSRNTHGTFSEDSVTTHAEKKGIEKKGREGNTRADAPPPSEPIPLKRARGTRLPPDFPLTDDMRRWASEKVPRLDLDYAHEEFCTYWRGEGTPKLDWEQTWRNGMLKAHERLSRLGTPRYQSQADHNSGGRRRLVL